MEKENEDDDNGHDDLVHNGRRMMIMEVLACSKDC